MKKLLAAILLFAGVSWGQFVGAPSAYPKVTADTLSDTALTYWQVPPYLNGASIKMRSMTMNQLRTAVVGDTSGAVFDSLTVNDYFRQPGSNGYAVKVGGTSGPTTMLSCDGGEYAGFSQGAPATISGTIGGPDLFAQGGNSGYIQTTEDGSSFFAPAKSYTSTIFNGAYGLNRFIFVGFAGADSVTGSISADGLTWTNIKGNFTNGSISNAACNTTTCVLVGNSARVMTTDNFTTFTTQTFGGSTNLWGVAWSNSLSRWVVVGSSGTIKTSDDNGVTWDTRTSGVATQLLSVTRSASLGLFIATGASGVILTSADGITWAAQTSGTGRTLYYVYSGGDSLVAMGDSLKLLTSTNGLTWTIRTVAAPSTLELYSGAYTNGTHLISGETGVTYTSTDAVTWTPRGQVLPSCLPVFDTSAAAYLASPHPKTINDSVTLGGYAEGIYYQGAQGTPMVNLPPGSTGQTLQSRGEGLAPEWENPAAINAITTGSDFVSNPVIANPLAKYIRVSDTTWITSGGGFFDNPTADNDSSRYMSVVDRTGRDWSDVAAGGGQPLTGAASNGTRLVVCGDAGVIRYTDNEGSSWTAATAPVTPVLRAVHWNGAQYMIVGEVNASQGTVLTDADGAGTWTRRTTGVPNVALFRVAYNGSRYVVVGSSGTIITSDDAGVTWTARTSGTASNLRGAAWTGTQFVVTGASGVILTSADGTTWAPQTSGVSVQLQSVTYYDGLLVTVGDVSGGTSVILTSTDGVTWVRRTTTATNFLFSVNQLGGTFVTGGASGGNVQVSQDGITWAAVASGATATINAVATTTDNIFIVGGTGAIPGLARKSAGEFRNYVYASSANRTAGTGKLDSADVLYSAQPENVAIAGQVDFDVDGIEAPDLPYEFNILRGFKNTAYESNADRAGETDPMGDTMYAYSGTPLPVTIPLLVGYDVAILTPADVPFNFDIITFQDMVYALFVVQNQSLSPGPYYCFNAVYDFGVDNRFEFGAESSGEYATCAIYDAATGTLATRVSNAVGDAGDPITFVTQMSVSPSGVTVPSLGTGTNAPVCHTDGLLVECP